MSALDRLWLTSPAGRIVAGWRATDKALERLSSADPELALALHQFLLRLLAERLTSTSNMLRGFQEQGSRRGRRKQDEAESSGNGDARTPALATETARTE